MLYPAIKEELTHISAEIRKLQQQLLNFPPGHLQYQRNGKYIKWFQSEKGKQTLIPKKNILLTQQLAFKKYLSSRLSDLEHEEKSLQSYLNFYTNFTSNTEQFIAHPLYSTLLPPTLLPQSNELSVWINEPYIHNDTYSEQLKYHSISGNSLRSKSEVFIDQILYQNSIPYRYECLLQIGDYSLFPDFTIRHPQSGKLIYWEHFGMMDNPSYAQNTFQKLSLYTSHNYIPGVNLIATFETKNQPLDVTYIDVLIDHFFLS